MIWAIKMVAKLVLARLPVRYAWWQWLGLFRHGRMDQADYALKIFHLHADRAYPAGLPRGATLLELGPGDSVASALVAAAQGAGKIWLIDAGDFARKDVECYQRMALTLARSGLQVPDLSQVTTFEQILAACRASYLTQGLASLRQIPDDSVDLVWSHSVLEHVRKHEIAATLREIHRLLKPGARTSHNIDLRDHLSGALNNLRFTEAWWESPRVANSGFYTNRIPAVVLHRMFQETGLVMREEEFGRWSVLPTPRQAMDAQFQTYSDDELCRRTSSTLLEKKADMSAVEPAKPLITIGLTCYNAAATIASAIGSALAQTWPNFEIVIVDDCSTDDSVAVVQRTIEAAPHARLIRHSLNGGPAVARNSILAEARGEFIAFFDDDDESAPQRLQVQFEALHAYETASRQALVACFASGTRRYPNGYEIEIAAIGSRAVIPTGEEVAAYLLFNGRREGRFYGGGTPTCALMARASTFKAIGGFDANLRRVEDVDFAIRLGLAGGHFVGCPETLYRQRATDGADKTAAKNLEAELGLVEKHAGYLRMLGRYHYSNSWFRIRYFHFSGQRLKFLVTLTIFLVRYPRWGLRHLLRSAPARLAHERGMKSEAGAGK